MARFAQWKGTSLVAGIIVLTTFSPESKGQDEGPVDPGTVAEQGVVLHSIAFSRDASHVAVAGNCLRVYDLKSGELVNKVDFRRRVQTVAFSRAEQNVFVTAGNDGTVCFWRVTADKPYRIVKGHQGSVMGVAFSPDAKLLATGGGTLEHGKWAHGEIGLWNVESGERLRTLKFDDWGSNCVAFSGDGKLVCFSKNSSFDNVSSTIEVYDVSTWKCIRSISFWPGFALSVSFFPDSRQVLIAGGFCEPREQGCSPTGKIWVASANDDDAHELEKLDDGAGEWHGYFRGAAVLMTGDRFFTTKDAPRAARNVEKPQRGKPIVAVFEMRDAKNGKLIWSRDSDISTGGGSLVTVSPDGKTVGCCDQNKIMVLESESGKFVRGIGVE